MSLAGVPVHDGSGAPAFERVVSVGEKRAAIALFSASLAFAIVFHSLFFHLSDAMRGDVVYHRGVAMTMTAGHFQGQGPLPGLLSYFGGLYPLILGWTSRLLGVAFDPMLSVISWLVTPLLPLSFLALGRSVFRSRWCLETGFLVLLGTAGSSIGHVPDASWVYSVLPSGTGEWPLYPRDVALLLLVVSLAVTLRREAHRNRLFAALLAGVAVTFQPQIGVYNVLVLLGVEAWRLWPARRVRASLACGLLVGGVAVLTSSWWWVPRLVAVFRDRPLLLQSYPGRTQPNLTPLGLLLALGVCGVLAALSLVLALRRKVSLGFFGIWLGLCAPLVVVANLVEADGFLTGRRSLFLAGVPIVVCAAVGAAQLARRLPTTPTVAVVAIVTLSLSAAEVVPTLDVVSQAWISTSARQPLDSARNWDGALSVLRRHFAQHGPGVVIAPDNDALSLWSRTGAQVVSLHLSGIVKLGFDPRKMTGSGYLSRVHALDAAFRQGRAGICRLAREQRSSMLLLRTRDGLGGSYDLRPAAHYRVPPDEVTHATINRPVGPHARYFDRGDTDYLTLSPGARIPLNWHSNRVREVEVDLPAPAKRRDRVGLQLGNGKVLAPAAESDFQMIFQTPVGVPRASSLVVRSAVNIERVIGFEHLPGVSAARPEDALQALRTATVCQ